MTGTLWVDIEDLIQYMGFHARPSGIQRVVLEISRALHARRGASGMVRFVRYDSVNDSFRSVEWADFETVFSALVQEPVGRPGMRIAQNALPYPALRRLVRGVLRRLPESLHFQVRNALIAQERAFRAWARLLRASVRDLSRRSRQLIHKLGRSNASATESDDPASRMTELSFAAAVAPGDTLLTLGAFWSNPNYPALLKKHRTRFGLRYALLIHDIIPLRRPEWCERDVTSTFRECFDRIMPLCDVVLTVSEATAADIVAYTRKHRIALPGPVVPIPMGSGFGPEHPMALSPRTDRLPPAGSYVLFVSTIEARKNHALLFRVWRRLLEELPTDAVPKLVFAGRIGWLVDDLMRQIANADYLGGKIIILENPDDTELAALYQGCQFTVFPSLYEGWGLPVTESLSFGKPCLIADRTSLPEAGGDLVRRFDPDDLHATYAAIRDVILDPKGLARWEENIRREFRPVSWTASAEALLAALGYTAGRGVAAADRDRGMALSETEALP